MAEFDWNDFYKKALQILVRQFSQQLDIAHQQAMSSVYLINNYINVGSLLTAEDKYKDLQILVSHFNQYPTIALSQAMGALNLSNHYGAAKDFAKAEIKYQHLIALINQFKQDLDIGRRQATGAYKLILEYEEVKGIVNRHVLILFTVSYAIFTSLWCHFICIKNYEET